MKIGFHDLQNIKIRKINIMFIGFFNTKPPVCASILEINSELHQELIQGF